MITVRNHYADMHDIVLTRLRSATVVAILFLTELDNAAYFFLLGEEIRARVEANPRRWRCTTTAYPGSDALAIERRARMCMSK